MVIRLKLAIDRKLTLGGVLTHHYGFVDSFLTKDKIPMKLELYTFVQMYFFFLLSQVVSMLVGES